MGVDNVGERRRVKFAVAASNDSRSSWHIYPAAQLTVRWSFNSPLVLDRRKIISIDAVKAHFSHAGTFNGTVEYDALKPELNHRHSWLVYH
jgi:hypothetical protein